MQNNFQLSEPSAFEKKSYPYLFHGISDTKKPFGYESSLPKQIYLSQMQIDSNKVNPLQSNY